MPRLPTGTLESGIFQLINETGDSDIDLHEDAVIEGDIMRQAYDALLRWLLKPKPRL
jgi:hypothetical protein